MGWLWDKDFKNWLVWINFLHLSFFPLKHPCPVNQLVIKKIIYIYFVAGTVALNSAFSWFSSYPDYFDLRIFPANCPPVHFNLYCLNAHCWVSLWPFWKVFHHTIINVKYWCTQNGTHTHTWKAAGYRHGTGQGHLLHFPLIPLSTFGKGRL